MMGFFTELLKAAKEQSLNQVQIITDRSLEKDPSSDCPGTGSQRAPQPLDWTAGVPTGGNHHSTIPIHSFPSSQVAMFRKMRGLPEFPAEQYGAGDVLSHLTASLDVDGVRLTMLPNPSHLEAVNPVAAGKARAREMRAGRGQYGSERVGEGALCVQVHGDGALAGQGVNQETLQLSQVPHYAVGGSLHLVVNNQVAFTAPGERGRSSTHCTGLARQIEAPVIHVNGDCPEEVVKATRLAMEYRQKFRKDVFVDLVCFRRWGHNELDDPTMTNPALYSAIQVCTRILKSPFINSSHPGPSQRARPVQRLVDRGGLAHRGGEEECGGGAHGLALGEFPSD